MYLFTRRVVTNPAQFRAGVAHAISMTEYVNQRTDLELSLYQTLQGEPLGTLTFAYRTESFAASLESVDEMIASDEYLSKVEAGAAYYVGNAVDRLGRFAHIAGELSGPPAAASVVTATINLPQVSRAMEWSVDVADYITNLSGVPIAVVTSNVGQYGTVSWISYGQSVAQLEQSQEKSNADPGFLQRLADSAELFVPADVIGDVGERLPTSPVIGHTTIFPGKPRSRRRARPATRIRS